MAEKVIVNVEEMCSIAEAIRDKTKNSYTMKITDMPNKILSISEGDVAVCAVQFPSNHVNETLYYINKDLELVEYTRKTNEVLIIYPVIDSIVSCDINVFDGETYIVESAGSIEKINNYSFVVKSITKFNYADGAPT